MSSVKPSFGRVQIFTVASSEQVASKFVWKGENLTSQTGAVCPLIKNLFSGILTGLVQSKT